MQYSNILLVCGLFATALAAPVSGNVKRSAAVLKETTYDQFSVSSGVAGNALAEVDAKFNIDKGNLAGVAASDLAIISKAAQISESAEIDAGGFNDAIAAAGGVKSAAGKLLQNGKIKNKVLKLETDVLRLEIEQAQGKTGLDAQIAAQKTKLANNVKLDQAAKGQKATAISFAGSD